MTINEVTSVAEKYGWRLLVWQPQTYMVSYVKGNARVNVYITKMTVGTCIAHPFKGRTQLFRRHVSPRLLERIFANPRIHTGRGYYGYNRQNDFTT